MTPHVGMSAMAAQNSSSAVASISVEYSREQIELLKRTICKDASDDEFQLFIWQCKRTGLDAMSRQIYAIRRWDGSQKREVMQTQTSIDGFRLIAERTGKYAGQLGPFWCGRDGVWLDVWLSDDPPAAARVASLRTDFTEPLWAVARFDEYVQVRKDGTPNSMWQRMPATMIAKCAESQALRKAFPHELSGLYTTEELSHSTVDGIVDGTVDTNTGEVRDSSAPKQPSPGQLKLRENLIRSHVFTDEERQLLNDALSASHTERKASTQIDWLTKEMTARKKAEKEKAAQEEPAAAPQSREPGEDDDWDDGLPLR